MNEYFYIVLSTGKIVRLHRDKIHTKSPVEGKNSITYSGHPAKTYTVPPEDWFHKLSAALDRAAEVCRDSAKAELEKARVLEEKADDLEACEIDDIERHVEFRA